MNREWKQATRQADLERVRVLLANGAGIDSRDEHGQTELVRFLIENEADRNVTSQYNLSALMLAIIAGHQEIAQLLIEVGANVDVRSSHNFCGTTALVLAERGGYTKVVALLKQ